MTTAAEWVQGARPRTLGAAISPVLVGTAAAYVGADRVIWWRAGAALVVALALQVGVNYANDYSDGVRGAAAGLALAIAVDLRLLIVGIIAIAAAALYTGGPRPYGYSGLGEVAVLVFFGVVATAGSAYVQLERVPATAWWGSLPVGLLACAILLANNIRDVDTDRSAGKRTLAVRIGAGRARALFVGSIAGAFVAVVAVGVLAPPALIALAAAPL